MFILKRLLVVDDNIGIQLLLYYFFSEKGFDVSLASNGKEAIKKVCSKAPLLVLLDIIMPGMSGLETIRELNKLHPEIPVIVMTAYIELQTVVEAKRNGLIRYHVNKPFDLDEICELVNNVLLENNTKKLASGRKSFSASPLPKAT